MKNYCWHRIYMCGFLAALPALGVAFPLSAEQVHKQAQPMKPKKITAKPLAAKIVSAAANFNGIGITAVDAKNSTLKIGWLYKPSVTLYEIVVTRATRFKQAEKGLGIEEIKAGDVLLEVRHDNFDQGQRSASFGAEHLVVRSLNPPILDFKGSLSSSGSLPKLKPGQTWQEAIHESVRSDEIEGIGVFVPHRSWRDPEIGKWQSATTLVLQEPNGMTFIRSSTIKPLTMSGFSIGQPVGFEGTTRPNGKVTATTIWLIVEKPQLQKK